MKKLLTIIFALALLATSCKSVDPVTRYAKEHKNKEFKGYKKIK